MKARLILPPEQRYSSPEAKQRREEVKELEKHNGKQSPAELFADPKTEALLEELLAKPEPPSIPEPSIKTQPKNSWYKPIVDFFTWLAEKI